MELLPYFVKNKYNFEITIETSKNKYKFCVDVKENNVFSYYFQKTKSNEILQEHNCNISEELFRGLLEKLDTDNYIVNEKNKRILFFVLDMQENKIRKGCDYIGIDFCIF